MEQVKQPLLSPRRISAGEYKASITEGLSFLNRVRVKTVLNLQASMPLMEHEIERVVHGTALKLPSMTSFMAYLFSPKTYKNIESTGGKLESDNSTIGLWHRVVEVPRSFVGVVAFLPQILGVYSSTFLGEVYGADKKLTERKFYQYPLTLMLAPVNFGIEGLTTLIGNTTNAFYRTWGILTELVKGNLERAGESAKLAVKHTGKLVLPAAIGLGAAVGGAYLVSGTSPLTVLEQVAQFGTNLLSGNFSPSSINPAHSVAELLIVCSTIIAIGAINKFIDECYKAYFSSNNEQQQALMGEEIDDDKPALKKPGHEIGDTPASHPKSLYQSIEESPQTLYRVSDSSIYPGVQTAPPPPDTPRTPPPETPNTATSSIDEDEVGASFNSKEKKDETLIGQNVNGFHSKPTSRSGSRRPSLTITVEPPESQPPNGPGLGTNPSN